MLLNGISAKPAFDAGSQANLFHDYLKFVLDQPVIVTVNSVVNSDRADLVYPSWVVSRC